MWFWNLLWWVLWLCILVPLGLYILYWIFVWVGKFIKFIFSPITNYIKKQDEIRRQKKENEREEEYQRALASWNKDAKVSKECYFLMKTVREREKEQRKEQRKEKEKISKYGYNMSDEEFERLERIKKQKAEYDALPQEEKDKLKRKRKRDWIIIIICLSIVMLPSIIMAILSALGIM